MPKHRLCHGVNRSVRLLNNFDFQGIFGALETRPTGVLVVYSIGKTATAADMGSAAQRVLTTEPSRRLAVTNNAKLLIPFRNFQEKMNSAQAAVHENMPAG